MARLTENEIERINNYEKQWKVKTNGSKFTIISLAVRKKENIAVNGQLIPFKERESSGPPFRKNRNSHSCSRHH